MVQQQIRYGVIHCHTENSLKDSVLTPTYLIKRAKELGAPAVAITDHGTLTGVFEFIRAAKEYGVKAVLGVEAYVQEDDQHKREHLLLLAKDYAGYQAISRAVSESNQRIIKDVPCFNREMINKYFGKGSIGHGKVIATSACVGGILSFALLQNNELKESLAKKIERAEACAKPTDRHYLRDKETLAKCSELVRQLIEERDRLKRLAEKRYTKREKAVEKLTGEERDRALLALEAEKAESAQAAEKLPSIKIQLDLFKQQETRSRQICRAAEQDHCKYETLCAEIEEYKQRIRTPEELYQQFLQTARWYSDVFGKENFYVELQYHGLPSEKEAMPMLIKVALELNLPFLATNDVHYANNTSSDIRARQLVSSLRYNKWFSLRTGDDQYYIKTDEELAASLREILPYTIVERAIKGIKSIVDQCNVEFPNVTHFPRYISNVPGETAQQRLRYLVEKGIRERYPINAFPYRDRVEYELKVIEDMHYTDYLCIVQDYVEYGRSLGKQVPEKVGYSIGPGRGSAAGSLVCYLIGITSVDPMPYGLLFERFLNPDRVSYPDIDVDFSIEVRPKVIDYIKRKYGENAVSAIYTKGTLAAKNAVLSAARLRGLETGTEGAYQSLGASISSAIPPNTKLEKCIKDLRDKFEHNDDALHIIEDALLIEGAAVNYGTHAAGIIIADNGDIREYVPLMWNTSSEQWCTQCDMVESEKQAGLLKFDFLVLRNLDVISHTLRLIKRNHGITIDIEHVPQEKRVYREIFCKGKTDFVFQFESNGMKQLLRQFKPEIHEHLVLLNALFRPGPSQYVKEICAIRDGLKAPSYICEAAKEILEITYGVPIYQEQIMRLCNQVAGFTLGEADTIRRYMSKKEADKMELYRPKFVDGLVANGVDRDAAESYWEELMKFASYSFNKSHSAVYATLAYYTAWLKYHYPTEYMTAAMTFAPKTASQNSILASFAKECSALNVKLLPPDINHSDYNYVNHNGGILFGLSNIKNVASAAEVILAERESNGLFRSFKDFLLRTKPRKDVCESLIDSGALDCWCSNRTAMKSILPSLLEDVRCIIDVREALQHTNDPHTVQSLKNKLDEHNKHYQCTMIPVYMPENETQKLQMERSLLGMYISGHPIDDYPSAQTQRTVSVDEVSQGGNVETLCGCVSELKIKNRKRDGKPMAFFLLDDASGSIEVCCFCDAYSQYGSLIEEGAVISVRGKIDTEHNDEDIFYKLIVEHIEKLPRRERKLLVKVNGLHRWAEKVFPLLKPFSCPDGLSVIVYDTVLKEKRETTMRVSHDALHIDCNDASIQLTD